MDGQIEAAAKPQRHLVQFYGPDAIPLVRNVGAYVARGLAAGGAAVVIANPAHCAAIGARLVACGVDAGAARASGRLKLFDAKETLDQFMIEGEPHRGRFDAAVGGVVRDMAAEWGAGNLRGFGEMVGLLWRAGNRAAALMLERFWNELLALNGFALYCAYPLDVLAAGFRHEDVDGVLAMHTDVIDTGAPGQLGNAVLRALDEIMGGRADGLKQLMRTTPVRADWAALPEGEATVLWLRHNLPDQVDRILARARRHFD